MTDGEYIPRFRLTEEEKLRVIASCPICTSSNLDPANGPNSANGWVKCYDCGHGPFWWLRDKQPVCPDCKNETISIDEDNDCVTCDYCSSTWETIASFKVALREMEGSP